MPSPQSMHLGPLGAALAAYLKPRRSASNLAARRGKKRAEPSAQFADAGEPVATMAALLSFAGSMQLAGLLSEFEQPPDAIKSEESGELVARVHREIETIRVRVERPLQEPFHPRYKLADASQAWAVIDEANGWDGQVQAVAAASTALWAPLGEFFSSRIEFVRASMLDVRSEIAADLRAAGSEASRLETLDRVLHAAMRESTDRLFAKLLPAMETVFFEDLQEELASIRSRDPSRPTVEALATWYRGEGLFARHLRSGSGIVMGVLEFEADRLSVLAQACCGAVDC